MHQIKTRLRTHHSPQGNTKINTVRSDNNDFPLGERRLGYIQLYIHKTQVENVMEVEFFKCFMNSNSKCHSFQVSSMAAGSKRVSRAGGFKKIKFYCHV